MNRPLVLTGVALGVAVALTGCGGTKKAATVAESASAKARHRSPAAAPAPSATATVAGNVKVGGFCKLTGTVGKTTGGAWARCLKRPGDKRARWYSQAPSRGGARAGQYCSPAGSTAKSPTGAKLTCTKKAGDSRPRWRAK
ncbi:hypothetical protein [Actinomadura sp. DC4]|uniref:hypothetical protein n=1 Tax=Actinomadura sp. DC4 TaxID=3055069 RepID=UPI0025B23525|nr:hypothetical protein [Actinomadura sp. DC4]MDN3355346.1 hypothetical protein [Actinomadura sp. DC4]